MSIEAYNLLGIDTKLVNGKRPEEIDLILKNAYEEKLNSLTVKMNEILKNSGTYLEKLEKINDCIQEFFRISFAMG